MKVIPVVDEIRSLREQWHTLSPNELAAKIVDIESHAKGGSATTQKLVQGLVAEFVFPILSELRDGPLSFARTIHSLARKVTKSESLQGVMTRLNATQLGEIMRCAGGKS